MELDDDRTPEQRKSHRLIVAGTDTFMSGWGKACDGVSYAGWACLPEQVNTVERWVRSRSDMKRVRVVSGNWRPKGTGHAHIYVVDQKHAALRGES
jgi:hypothetical protein